MKDIQIGNLKTVWVQNEQDFEKLKEDISSYESSTSDVVTKMKRIEYEKAKLIDDNVKLLNENEKLRKQLLNVTFMQEASDGYDSNRLKSQ